MEREGGCRWLRGRAGTGNREQVGGQVLEREGGCMWWRGREQG